MIGDISASAQELGWRSKWHLSQKLFQVKLLGETLFASDRSVLNPNMELLFQGPTLRIVNFNFKLCPRELDEAGMCRKHYQVLQKEHGANFRLKCFPHTPNIFTLEYIFGDTDGEHPFLPKFKPVALQSFNVNYTPDNNYMTHPDGSMTI